MNNKDLPFEVMVDDNFHYMDESERYSAGKFATYEEALNLAKSIVDESLSSGYKRGISAGKLYELYTMFGEDPFIVDNEPNSSNSYPRFSAWEYAKERAQDICGDK